jgi:hypothetical protein
LEEQDGVIDAVIGGHSKQASAYLQGVARTQRRMYDRSVRTAMLIFMALCVETVSAPQANARTLSPPGDLTDPAGAVADAGASRSFVERVASARALDGAELIKIGDLHEVQNHLLEALP